MSASERVGESVRRGVMLVLSSPSGAGKTTIARRLMEMEPDVELSISATTRSPRGDEVSGKHYHFVAPDEFERMRDSGELLEWAQVHDYFYGSPRAGVERALESGKDVLFDIDWQGGEQLLRSARDDLACVFILPPSMAELKDRLRKRAEDSDEVIERRFVNARAEIPKWKFYDYVIVNRDLDETVSEVHSILIAERARRHRRAALDSLERKLLSSS